MANSKRQYIAIIGGLKELSQEKKLKAQDFAEKLGAALAETGLGIVVYLAEDWCLEPYVVKGYVDKLKEKKNAGEFKGNEYCNSIQKRYIDSQKDKVNFQQENALPEAFSTLQPFPNDQWEAPFYRSLAEECGVDALLLMAGKQSVFIAGQIAIACKKPILAINGFDGSSEVIWKELSTRSDGKYPGRVDPKELIEWLKAECDNKLNEKKLQIKKDNLYLTINSQKKNSFYAISSFAALLFVVYFSIIKLPAPEYYTVLTSLGLIAAGATGAGVRNIAWGSKDILSSSSIILGSIAGFLVGLAYLIPQWIGAPGVLDPSAQEVTANDKIQFFSVLVVAFIAGLGFDTVFDKMKSQSKDLPTGKIN